jgi:hypothetical protein
MVALEEIPRGAAGESQHRGLLVSWRPDGGKSGVLKGTERTAHLQDET